MNKSLTAIFDGKVLRPDDPLDLEPNKRYQITVEVLPLAENAWDVLDKLTGSVTAPADWSKEHDHYIHGTPKRQSEAGS
jgi:hypothetical protein